MLLPALLVAFAVQVPEPPAPAAISWDAPPACPGPDALTAAIVQRLGRPLADAEVQLSGIVVQHAAAPRWRLRLALTANRRSQTRTLTAERCASLVDATALLVALTLTRRDAPSAEPLKEDAPAPAPAASVAPVPAPEPVLPEFGDELAAPAPAAPVDPVAPASAPAPRGPGVALRLQGGPEYGALPGLTVTAALAVGLLWRRMRLELQGLYLAPRSERRDASEVKVSLFSGAALVCGRPGRGSVELPVCGGLEVGGARGVARGPGARSGTHVWLAGVASAGVAWHVRPRLSLTLALQGLVHLYVPRFELADPGPAETLFRPAPVSGRLLFGLELRLGDRW